MDKLIYAAILIKLLMTLPQVLQIWVVQNASGVSVYTWTTYAIVTVFWIIYGIMHREKPVILSSAILVTLEIAVAVGALLYGSV